ncbi:lysine-specific demethylase JMJ28 isoform X2 [Rosa rugosa]|uniref:lysine-specific demethylase JMJ28 isoform X2 n=1 Tax=Rosa rugosa TaxID=74645 RepID=UPI002B410304|nr:lysine-specific demethylase JMJ28 isoform X2 [Rosa rugosa]
MDPLAGPVPEHMRCTRTDGRQWRCKRRVMENMKLCEIHYLQGRHRQYREKVPEELKIQRKTQTAPCEDRDGGGEGGGIRAKKVDDLVTLLKRKRAAEEAAPVKIKKAKVKKKKKKKKKRRGGEKKCELNLELIRMVLKREVEKRNTPQKKKKKMRVLVEEEGSEGEEGLDLTRDLPNGRMAISSSSSQSLGGNVGSNSGSDVRVGAELGPPVPTTTRRCFRSKNIEPMPVGTVQVLPYGDENEGRLRKGKRKRCHWCQRSGSSASSSLIKCSSCKKHLFCLSCIKERYFDTQEEVKMACPVCRGTCPCKECSENQPKDAESKDYVGVKNKVEIILHFHYLVCMLLPVLKQINQDQKFELEAEAKMRGKKLSEVYIKQAEFSCSEQNSCNKCKAPIVDLHRSCQNCSYNLCLSCCRDHFQGTLRGGINTFLSKCSNINDTWVSGKGKVQKRPITTHKQNVRYLSSFASTNWNACNAVDGISCPPKEFGGCGDSFLDLRCFFPLSWIKELEVSAEEIVCSYEFPETSDMSLSCPLCLDTDQNVDGLQQLQEAALRENSNDNYLFYPTLSDVHGDNVEHFQKHWSKGHPVIVRDVLRSTSDLSWDPVFMFCTYLERSIARYENNKNPQEAIHCLDWCEVEMGIRQYFMGSLNGRTQKDMWSETLKLKGWLSSQLFQEQFPAHYAEIIQALPLQEYMNPSSGLLNVAARMPQEIPKPDLGPCVYISYGCSEQFVQADSVIKLCYDSYDVVNILAHTSDAPISDEQVSKIRKLLKRHNQNQRESSRNTSEQTRAKKVNGNSALHSQNKEQVRSHNVIGEEMHLRKRIARESCFSAATREECTRNLKESNMSLDGESDVDSEATLSCSGSINGDETSEDEESPDLLESSNGHEKPFVESCTAQWDVFRRQDVPKLVEYLRRHCNEFTRKYDVHKHVAHPILDQSFFLDSIHKIRLKEEFKIEPWTFEQHIGEAVIIPAGCPYQISSPKSCVHVVLDFMSPENVTECIQLTDEVRLLPEDHKAKVDKLEVKRMALYSISSAIKEIRELTCAIG